MEAYFYVSQSQSGHVSAIKKLLKNRMTSKLFQFKWHMQDNPMVLYLHNTIISWQ